jgi:DNA-binding transcriptional ArsR family regulator
MATPQVDSSVVFRALADPTRRAILDALRSGGQPVGRIAEGFRVSRPAISKHVRVLREANLVLVVESPDGRERVCELNPAPLRQIDGWLDNYRQFWGRKLRNLKNYVERGLED